jgi:hypothetical protein
MDKDGNWIILDNYKKINVKGRGTVLSVRLEDDENILVGDVVVAGNEVFLVRGVETSFGIKRNNMVGLVVRKVGLMTKWPELKCYRNDVVEWVIAFSPEDATDVWCELMGETKEDYSDGWTEVDPDSSLKIVDEYDSAKVNEKMVSEWIKEKGRCYLCSTEY